jgi:hypothetical protein
MSFKACSFDMDMPLGAVPQRPIAEGAAAVFEHLLEMFAPRDLWLRLDGREVVQLHRTEDGGADEVRWLDEEVRPGEVLTRCPPGPAADLVRELRATLAARSPASLYIGANGALRHQAPGTTAADWYGRWQLETGVLHDLVEVRLQWTEDMHAFEFELPHSGYPLTTVQLRSNDSVGPGDPDAARANRAAILPVLMAIPRCLGLTAEQVEWSNGGDYGPLFPDDAAELRGVWLPRLRAA